MCPGGDSRTDDTHCDRLISRVKGLVHPPVSPTRQSRIAVFCRTDDLNAEKCRSDPSCSSCVQHPAAQHTYRGVRRRLRRASPLWLLTTLGPDATALLLGELCLRRRVPAQLDQDRQSLVGRGRADPAYALVWLVHVSERELNPHALDLQLCDLKRKADSKRAGQRPDDVCPRGTCALTTRLAVGWGVPDLYRRSPTIHLRVIVFTCGNSNASSRRRGRRGGGASTRRRCPGTTRCCATGDARHVRGRRSRPPATAHPDPQLPAADTTFGACRGLVAWLMSILTGTAADVPAGAVMTVVPRHGLIGAVGWPTCAWTGPGGWPPTRSAFCSACRPSGRRPTFRPDGALSGWTLASVRRVTPGRCKAYGVAHPLRVPAR
jgi:hypothetical protein